MREFVMAMGSVSLQMQNRSCTHCDVEEGDDFSLGRESLKVCGKCRSVLYCSPGLPRGAHTNAQKFVPHLSSSSTQRAKRRTGGRNTSNCASHKAQEWRKRRRRS